MQTNPVTLEVVQYTLQSITQEMGIILSRTALSLNLKERRDYSAAIFTSTGELIARAEHNPLQLGVMPAVIESVLNHIPLQEMKQGDAIIANDPYINGTHTPEICIIKPVYFYGHPLALAAVTARHADTGGCSPGSMSTEARNIFYEGMRIPPLKIIEQGKINRNLLEMITNNLRTPQEFRSDLQAQLSAAYTGEKRIQELAARYNPKNVKKIIEEIINRTEYRMREALNQLPPGEYKFEDCLESNLYAQESIKLTVKITIDSEGLTADFSGISRQVESPVNASPALAKACVYYAAGVFVAPELPGNQGIIKPVKVITPRGTLVNPEFPAPLGHSPVITAERLTDIVIGALARALPGSTISAGTGGTNLITISGRKSDGNDFYSYTENLGGGQGAMSWRDGMDGVQAQVTNARNIPVEVIENNYPLRVEKLGLRPDSCGSGEYRGGCGVEKQIRLLDPGATVTINLGRSKSVPWGFSEGQHGKIAHCTIQRPGEEIEELVPATFTGKLPPGTLITLKTAGGGGYGDPEKRSNSKIERDFKDGLVSSQISNKD